MNNDQNKSIDKNVLETSKVSQYSGHLKTIQKLFKSLEIIQAFWLKHSVLIKQLIHDEVHKGNLRQREREHLYESRVSNTA